MIVEIQNPAFWEIMALSASLGALLGHNFWLIRAKQKASSEKRLRVEAHVGHHFPVGESAISPERIADFRLFSGEGERNIDDYRIEGTALIAEFDSIGSGSQMAAITLHPRPITLEPGAFAGYLREEESNLLHEESSVQQPQTEIYSKYAKAILVSRPEDEIACSVIGQKMEIVLEQNPAALADGDPLPVRILFEGQAIAGVRVSSGCDRLNAGGYVSHARTDPEGRALIDLPVGGDWFLRSHYIRPHPDPEVAMWESFWPSLTFRLRDRCSEIQ